MPKRDVAPIGAPCWVDLITSDPDRARAFYGELFGWTSEDAGPEYGGYINFSKDGMRVAGGMRNDGSSGMPDVWSVYLATDDAQTHRQRRGLERRPGDRAADGGRPARHDGRRDRRGPGRDRRLAAGASSRGFGVFAETGAPAWFELHTRDYDAAVDFYRKVFRLGRARR